MKKNFLKLFFLSLLIPFLVQADSGYDEEEAPQTQKIESKPKSKPKTTTLFAEYDNRILFGIVQFGYERIKPNDVYVGVQGWFLPIIENNNPGISEFEVRTGYNFFFNQRDHLTPIAGVGVFKDFHKKHFHSSCLWEKHSYTKSAVVYGTVGFLYEHEFNNLFALGLNVKGMLGGSTSNEWYKKWRSTVGGIDVSVPITFRFAKGRRWYACIEPFNIYLHGSNISRDYFGFRNTFGYRF
ncbi:MAG: hypothetical protein HKM07_05415 [Chlamydiae bacterium]|nr:hypothetical protein [Chlamydiota bacterium]